MPNTFTISTTICKFLRKDYCSIYRHIKLRTKVAIKVVDHFYIRVVNPDQEERNS